MPSRKDSTCGAQPCKLTTFITQEVADAIEAKAKASYEFTRATDYLAVLIGLASASPASVEAPKERDLTGPELDRAMGWSAAHRRRLGLTPAYHAGDEQRSPRFHLDDVRRELAERGPKATKAKPKREPDVDVDADLSRAGLRLLGGAR